VSMRGKPFEPGNKFGKGRPAGSRNKVSGEGQALLLSHAEPLTRKCIVMALQGDTKAMQLCLDRALPVRRDQPVKFGNLPMGSAEEITKAFEIVAQKVAKGQITVTQGMGFAEVIETRRRTIETLDLAERVRILEQKQSLEQRA
jgi:hypothetical protein